MVRTPSMLAPRRLSVPLPRSPIRAVATRRAVLRRRARLLVVAPTLTSRIATVLGLFALVDALWPHHWSMLSAFDPIVPGRTRAAVEATATVSALILLRVAAGLRKRKRAAWRLAVFAGSVIVVADLVRDQERPVEGAAALALLVILLVTRSRFTAQPDPRSRWFALGLAAQIMTVALVYGTVLLWLPGHVPAGTSAGDRLREVLLSVAGSGGTVHIRDHAYADTVHVTLLGFGLLALLCVPVLLMRSVEPAARLSVLDDAGLRRLLDRHGARDSLGYFALRADKAVVWSPTGKAALTYRVVCGVALVSGDPIGDPEAWPGAIGAYRALVERYGWTPAVVGGSELGAVVFRRELGLSALVLGDEAVVTASRFCLAGRAMRGVRQACTRVERAGYVARVCRSADLTPAEVSALRSAAEAWRADPVERGFSMALSRLGDPRDPDCVVVTAHQDGELRGLLHFVPWGRAGVSLDLMRRARSADNGVNEFMIAAVLAAAPGLGVEQVSLNFAAFRDVLERGARIGAGPVLRLWRRGLLIASRWWQIESLYRFNAKFQPDWQPRFLCFPSVRDLPRVALAAMEAEAFLVRPQLADRLLGRGRRRAPARVPG